MAIFTILRTLDIFPFLSLEKLAKELQSLCIIMKSSRVFIIAAEYTCYIITAEVVLTQCSFRRGRTTELRGGMTKQYSEVMLCPLVLQLHRSSVHNLRLASSGPIKA